MAEKKYIPIVALISIIIVIQLFTSLTGMQYYLTQLTMSAYYALVIMGLTVLMGYAGQLSLGHAAFFAMGGYTTAVLTTCNLMPVRGYGIIRFAEKVGFIDVYTNHYGVDIMHLTPWLSLLAAVLLTVLVAFLIGIPILKLKGHYLAMATLGFGIIIYRIVLGTRLFGEADGISEVPGFNLIGPLSVNGDPAARVQNYYIAAFLVVLVIVLLLNLVDSRAGRALRSIHGNEEAANAMGVNTTRYKLLVFVLSAVIASISGVFMTHFNGGIGPSEAGVMKSVSYVAIVAVGGMANLWGALFMGILLNFLSLRGYFGSYDEFVFGGILIVIMLFYPDGLLKKENYSKLAEKMQLVKQIFRPGEKK